jgi:hypothetical protein
MKNKSTVKLKGIFIIAALAAIVVGPSYGQAEIIATELLAPTSVILTPGGNLLVSEAGAETHGGRVSRVDRSGERLTVLDGLPSGIDVVGGMSGPNALDWEAGALLVVLGEGDMRRPGPSPGTEIPNPEGPSSPIFSSILRARFSQPVDLLEEGFVLGLQDQFTLADGHEVTLENSLGQTARVELHSDIKDLVPDPITITRASNPFGVASDTRTRLLGNVSFFNREAYLADAGANTLLKVFSSGRTLTLIRFAPVPNTRPFGPPVSEAVPTRVRLVEPHRKQALVTLFTGFPFPPGAGKVALVDLQTGAEETYIDGLTNPIDLLPLHRTGMADPELLVLEFTDDLLENGTGRLLYFASPDSAPEVLASGLISPAGMARDPLTGEIFIVQIFAGSVIRVQGP